MLVCGAAAGANQYTIDIQADRNLNVRGTATLTWRNETGRPSTEIPIVCDGRMKKATAGGAPLRIDRKRVLLPASIAPGSTALVEIEFEGNARGAYGYHMLSGPWHPKAVTFRSGTYNPKQPQADNYDLTLTAPAALVIAAAGELVEESAAPDGRRRRRWRLQNVTSFGLAASPDFVETRRNSAGVEIRLYQLRGDTRFDAVMADYAVDVIAFYKQTFGFYPHPAVVMLPGKFSSGGGYAPASGITVFHRNTGDDYVRWIVAHEVAHQYWGFDTVIDDGDFCHWPGLPLGIYSDQRYMASHGTLRFSSGQYRDAAAKGLDTTVRRTTEQMRALKFDWNNVVCHQKAYAVIRMLEDLIGTDRFAQLVQRLLERYRYQYLSFDDFYSTAEAISAQKLDWFFHDWVNTNAVASYAVEGVQRHETGVHVQIRRTGAARFPVEVRLTMRDGAQAVKRIAYDQEIQTVEFPATGEPKRVEIEPRGICPLIKQGKELWEQQ